MNANYEVVDQKNWDAYQDSEVIDFIDYLQTSTFVASNSGNIVLLAIKQDAASFTHSCCNPTVFTELQTKFGSTLSTIPDATGYALIAQTNGVLLAEDVPVSNSVGGTDAEFFNVPCLSPPPPPSLPAPPSGYEYIYGSSVFWPLDCTNWQTILWRYGEVFELGMLS